MKKTLTTLLAVFTLVVSMTSSMVYAESATDTKAKIQITNEVTATGINLSGKQYSVYQLFDATINNDGADGGTISYTLAEEFKDFFVTVIQLTDDEQLSATAETYIHTVYDEGTMTDFVSKLETYISEHSSITKATTISGTIYTDSGIESLTSEDLEAGYYLVLDTSTNGSTITAGMLVSLPAKDANNDFAANAVISLKGSQPSIDKEIWHNDLNTTGDWDTVGDYEIGDTVTFKIVSSFPNDITGYTEYVYSITDTMSDGISFDTGSLKIYLDESLSESSKVEGTLHKETMYTDDPDNRIFTLEFEMLEIKDKFPELKEFYIVYTGTVTDAAAIALDSETNTAQLEYSNNPYDETSVGYDEDTVYSYTFALDVFKTNSTGVTPLEDAVFSLFVNPLEESLDEYQVYLKQDETDPTIYYVQQSGTPDLSEAGSYAGYVVTGETGKFTILGLDDSITYILREEIAPDGYAKAQDSSFNIKASYDNNVIPVVSSSNSNLTVSGGTLSVNVINTSSELFPGTGGIGTTLFMIGGGAMMLFAGVLLIVKRKSISN